LLRSHLEIDITAVRHQAHVAVASGLGRRRPGFADATAGFAAGLAASARRFTDDLLANFDLFPFPTADAKLEYAVIGGCRGFRSFCRWRFAQRQIAAAADAALSG